MPARAREQGQSNRIGRRIEHLNFPQALAEHGGDDALPVTPRARERAQELAAGDERPRLGDQRRPFAAGERLDQDPGGEVERAVGSEERVAGERAHHLLALFQVGLDVFVNLAGGERNLAAEGLVEADVANDVDEADASDGGGEAGAPAGRRLQPARRMFDVGPHLARGGGVDGDAPEGTVAQDLQRHPLVILGERRQQQPRGEPPRKRQRRRWPRLVPPHRLAHRDGGGRRHDAHRQTLEDAANHLVG